MRFLTAVALAVVMLWVPVDGAAQRQPARLKGTTTVDTGRHPVTPHPTHITDSTLELSPCHS
jgi:hypothetical protein